MDKMSQRTQLRCVLKDIDDKAEQSLAVADIIMQLALPDGSICIYNSLPSEVDTKKLIAYFCKSRDVYMPVVDGDDMLLVKVDENTKYAIAHWGISEPIGKRLLPQDVCPSITITPLLGADKKLNRLGKGKGYYDRYFQIVNTYKIGLAFREQVVDEVICDEWDKPLDMLITPDGVNIKTGECLE